MSRTKLGWAQISMWDHILMGGVLAKGFGYPIYQSVLYRLSWPHRKLYKIRYDTICKGESNLVTLEDIGFVKLLCLWKLFQLQPFVFSCVWKREYISRSSCGNLFFKKCRYGMWIFFFYFPNPILLLKLTFFSDILMWNIL